MTGLGTLAMSKPISALEQYIKASAKKWAIVYGSQCGSTKEYANAINEGLGGIADVVDITTKTPRVEDYDFFIIGGWRNGNTVKPDSIPAFIKNNKAALKDKIGGLFIVLGNSGNAKLTTDLTSFLKQTLITPAGASDKIGKVFFGKSDPACNGLGFTYNNVKKEDGVAFGKQILSDSTGITHVAPGSGLGLELSHRTGSFSRLSTINYTIPHNGDVVLTICSIQGQKLTTLVSQHQSAGSYKVPWDGSNLAPGNYLYRLQVGNMVETRTARIVR
jgi:flavodoxin